MTSRAVKVGYLSVLYFSQGLPFGFQATALPTYLRASGLSLTGIGFLSALALPWVAKPIWAPLVDRWGRRRTWIAAMQSMMAITAATAAFVDPRTDLGVLLALVFSLNVFAATQDVAVDALAIDLLGPGDLGSGNAAQVVGYKVGMLTGGGLLVWASAEIGWRGLFAGMSILIAGALLVLQVVREPEGTATVPERRSLREVLAPLLATLRRPGAAWVAALGLTYKMGESMADAMFKPFLVDEGYTPAQIGLWFGTWGMAASIAGSIAGGVVATRLSPVRALAAAAAMRLGPLGYEWFLSLGHPGRAAVVTASVTEHFFGGLLTTTMFAFLMSRVDRRIGATHYTLLASLEVLGKAAGGWASGAMADAWDYPTVFGASVALSTLFLAVVLVPWRGPGGAPETSSE